MKNEDIKALSANDLKEKLAAEKEALQKLRFAHAISPIENPMRLRESRKLIARLNTELHAKTKNA